MRKIALVLALLLATWIAFDVHNQRANAGSSSSAEPIAELPLVVTAHTNSSDAITSWTDNATIGQKFAGIYTIPHDGQSVSVLVRIQQSPNGVFVDVATAASVSSLDTIVGSMDLSGTVGSHPSPTEDAADTAALLDAGS